MLLRAVKGQEKAIQILQGFIAQGSFTGGYLFSGPEGVGKKLTAYTIAAAVNCVLDSHDACGTCVSCRKIAREEHPDVHCIDGSVGFTGTLDQTRGPGGQSVKVEQPAESQIKIDCIRQLQRDISLRPYEGKKKVFIIDNAHTLTAEAQNALLKILEEPPKESLLILVTDKPGLLFKTIISRCKTVKFFPLPRKELESLLIEEHGLEAQSAHFLAYFSEGRLGRALCLKETDILLKKNAVIDLFTLSQRLDLEKLPAQNKFAVHEYLNILAAWFRDIYMARMGDSCEELINADRKVDALRLSQRYSDTDLRVIFDAISNSAMYLERNINIRLLLYSLGGQLCKG